MNKQIMQQAGFAKEVAEVEAGNCPFCKKTINMDDFKDDLSCREFKISGLCQACQNKVFNKENLLCRKESFFRYPSPYPAER